ncbi:MAG TPA: cytochrome c oxidase accessory protein CcoG [Chitinophagaceae bacterium]
MKQEIAPLEESVIESKKGLLDQSFRDSVATINKEGKRNFLFPKKPKGKLHNWRIAATLVYLTIFFGLPFIKYEGQPLFMFNIVERKFILFGQIFWPQDFFIFAIGLLTFIVFIILFTVVFGRVWCGWACPQTVFMEMVFRKIEFWLDGDSSAQKRLKEMPWNGYKLRKRATKMAVFFLISFLIANFALAYLISMDEVLMMVHEGIGRNLATFSALMGFTTIFFFVFYWFREQACIVVCPYGRLQGVLLDRKSMVVAYDYVRGEPRGKLKREAAADVPNGDCVDCFACVKVCPTGIDIRNGTQLECINCTACIDACDSIMEKINKPLGLIRYDSEENIQHARKKTFNWRMTAYSAILVILLGILTYLLVSRDDVDATVLRAQGQIFQNLPDGRISNVYNIKLANKTRKDLPMTLKLEGVKGEITMVTPNLVVPAESYHTATFFVKLDRNTITRRKTPITIGVYEGGEKIKSATTTFLGPGY